MSRLEQEHLGDLQKVRDATVASKGLLRKKQTTVEDLEAVIAKDRLETEATKNELRIKDKRHLQAQESFRQQCATREAQLKRQLVEARESMKRSRDKEAAFNGEYAKFEAERGKVLARNDTVAEELQRYVAEKTEFDTQVAEVAAKGEADQQESE